jgi:hypothetical protein
MGATTLIWRGFDSEAASVDHFGQAGTIRHLYRLFPHACVFLLGVRAEEAKTLARRNSEG